MVICKDYNSIVMCTMLSASKLASLDSDCTIANHQCDRSSGQNRLVSASKDLLRRFLPYKPKNIKPKSPKTDLNHLLPGSLGPRVFHAHGAKET